MTALELARRGARVVLACRSRERGEAAAFDLRQVREVSAGRDGEERTGTRRTQGCIEQRPEIQPLRRECGSVHQVPKWGCRSALVTQRSGTCNCCSKTFKDW